MTKMWQGIPREQIPWFPMIDPEKCDLCGRCVDFCPNHVFEMAEGQLEVVRPMDCLVGCSRCAAICRPKAIRFMEIRDLGLLLKQLRREQMQGF